MRATLNDLEQLVAFLNVEIDANRRNWQRQCKELLGKGEEALWECDSKMRDPRKAKAYQGLLRYRLRPFADPVYLNRSPEKAGEGNPLTGIVSMINEAGLSSSVDMRYESEDSAEEDYSGFRPFQRANQLAVVKWGGDKYKFAEVREARNVRQRFAWTLKDALVSQNIFRIMFCQYEKCRKWGIATRKGKTKFCSDTCRNRYNNEREDRKRRNKKLRAKKRRQQQKAANSKNNAAHLPQSS